MVKDWIHKLWELGFQFCLRKTFLLKLFRDGGGHRPSRGEVVIPRPWKHVSGGQDSNPSAPCPILQWGEHGCLSGVGRGPGRKCRPSRPQGSQEWALWGMGPFCPSVIGPSGYCESSSHHLGFGVPSRCWLWLAQALTALSGPSRWSGGTSWAPSCRVRAATWSL